ncbi:hypothetical protein EIN_060700 [Entamoeba invadens IP1]|uniref:hypothetical protein n=1 Tax=Entamoeba invadens IP1 TaxID=370355 RepID=UPI0002C3EE7B|nr:hypothetical protein EIN_060700 [Entamoeba invadens IP1]ELP93525.1 hypothetical protein EIN_060700 [Entamoeba invadens IP1]|eukprot:XP_004260296.1 hypothetical protein EIN_060700 [Entamoeba invadens IP1]
MKSVIFALLIVLYTNGYYCVVDNTEKKNECLLKNKDGQYEVVVEELQIESQNTLFLKISKHLLGKDVKISMKGKGPFILNSKEVIKGNIELDINPLTMMYFLYYGGNINVISKSKINLGVVYLNTTKEFLVKSNTVEFKILTFNELSQVLSHPKMSAKSTLLTKMIDFFYSKNKQPIDQIFEILESGLPQLHFNIFEKKLSELNSQIQKANISKISSQLRCKSCIFWFRFKMSASNALGLTSATDFCDMSFVPTTLCKITIQTSHSLSSKYFYDEKKAEEKYCKNYC